MRVLDGAIPPDEKRKIIEKLTAAGAEKACPRCGNAGFSLVDGYVNKLLQARPSGGLVLGGPVVPCAVVVCTKCGFVSEHALGALGLLPVPEKENKK